MAQVVLFVALGLALVSGPTPDVGLLSVPLILLGAAGFLAGAILAGSALRSLGPHLSPYPAPLHSGELVADGPYRLVRHPIYGGIVIMAAGASVAAVNPLAFAMTVILGGFFFAKSASEERMLVARYPGYLEYERQVTHRLIPRIL